MKRSFPLALMAGLGVAVSGCGNHGSTQGPITGRAQAVAPGPNVSGDPRLKFSSLPANFDPPSSLAADQARRGVWYFSSAPTGPNTSHAELFFLPGDATSAMTWDLGPSIIAGAESGIAVDNHGTVWVGAGKTLMRVDPATSSIGRWSLPTVADNLAAESFVPPGTRGSHEVRAIATDNAGHLAIAMSLSSAVLIFDTTSNTFSQVATVHHGEPQDVAYLANGTLAVGLKNFDDGHPDLVMLRAANGAVTTASAASWHVVSAGDHIATSFEGSQDVDQSGSVRQAMSVTFPKMSASQPAIGGPLAVLVDGRRLLGSHDGFLVVSSAGTSAIDVVLPGGMCRPHPFAPPAGASPQQNATTPVPCWSRALTLAVDAVGDVWFTSTDPQVRIGELPAGTF